MEWTTSYINTDADAILIAYILASVSLLSVIIITTLILVQRNRIKRIERNSAYEDDGKCTMLAESGFIGESARRTKLQNSFKPAKRVCFASLPTETSQSRIREISPHAFEAYKPAGVLPGAFVVPRKKYSKPPSMFRDLEGSQIDRGLYATNMDAESGYRDDGLQIRNSCCGSLRFSIYLDTSLNLLVVSLRQALDLVSKRHDEYPNPYFQVALNLPTGETPLKKQNQQSKIFKCNSSPRVEEEFYFTIPCAEVADQCRLEVLVYDCDQFSLDECIGYCWLTLGRLSLKSKPVNFWAEVLPFDDDDGKGYGEILISLAYVTQAQKLCVNIFKARNISADSTQSSRAIRVSLISQTTTGSGRLEKKRLKRKTTSPRREARNPQFNESLKFQVAKISLCDIVLEVEMLHEYGTFGMGIRPIGRLELKLADGDLWRAIIREGKSPARWYSFEKP